MVPGAFRTGPTVVPTFRYEPKAPRSPYTRSKSPQTPPNINGITKASKSPPTSLHGGSQTNTPKPRMHKHPPQTRSQGHVQSEVTDIKGFARAARAHRQEAMGSLRGGRPT